MTDITNYASIPIQNLMENIDYYKYNPSAIQRVILDHLDEVTSGKVNIVDPTNPFVFLLEASAVNTAVAIQENLINLRKQYPSLALTEEDLYLHMSDKDFVNRFATPAETDFTISIQANDLLNKLLYDSVEKVYKATIPRDTEFNIAGLTFTLQYPIDLRKFENGIIQLSYDAEIDSPLQTLSTNIIDYIVRRDLDSIDWIVFKVPVKQFSINSTFIPIQKSKLFTNDISYNDSFYYCRVYYRNNSSGNVWKEMLTTHTDQVFDPLKPTAVIKVFETIVNVTIPIVYVNSDMISGDVRIDVFTTKGNITVNLTNYKINSFEMKLKAIDEDRDLNDFTAVMSNLSYYCYNDTIVSGGTSSINFDDLRQRVIENSAGDRKLPITNKQLESTIQNKGFDLIKNVDTITNRIFLATSKLPKPLNTKLITPANIGISSFITNLDYLKTLDTVADNTNRVTIFSNNLFINKNGIISIVPKSDIDSLLAQTKSSIVSIVSSNKYLYNPFYYVLDNSQNEFEVRVYNLDSPEISNLSFISQNETLKLPVNTGGYSLIKTSYGYELTISTKSGNFYKNIPNSQVGLQIAFKPIGEIDYAYINGTFAGVTSTSERIFTFRIETNHDIDSNDSIIITNAKMFSNENIRAPMSLQTEIHVFHITTSISDEYIPSIDDGVIGSFILTPDSACITHESLQVKFGSSLKNLWTRSRSLSTGLLYDTYTVDEPLLYDKVIYDIDPTTGSIFAVNTVDNILEYNILHQIGDPVLDIEGDPIYKHRTGDVKLDVDGNPITISDLIVDRDIDILFVDGKYYFSNDAALISYRNEINGILDVWVTKDLNTIQDMLLEQTKIYFYPKTSLGLVKVYPDGLDEKLIDSGQSITIDLYVNSDVYMDLNIRQQITDTIISMLDVYIGDTTVNVSNIRTGIVNGLGGSIVSIEMSGLGGSSNYSIVVLSDEHNRLSLNKKLSLQQDGSFIIEEDVIINFHNIQK